MVVRRLVALLLALPAAAVADLGSEDRAEREAAIAALVAQGDAAIPGVREALKDPDWLARAGAVRVAKGIGAVSVVLDARSDPDPVVRYHVAIALLDLPGAADAVRALLEDPDPDVRAAAAEAAAKRGDLPARVLRDEDRWVKVRAAKALFRYAADKGAAAAIVLDTMDEQGDYATSMRMGRMLSDLGADAVPALLAALPRDKACEYQLRPALARIGAPAVPGLAALLADDDAGLVQCAAWTLRDIGEPAKRAVPALAAQLERDHAGVRLAVAGTLCGIEPEHPALPRALGLLLRDSDAYRRKLACQLAATIGPAARSLAAELASLAEDRETGDDALEALRVIGIEDPDAYRAIVRCIKEERHEGLLAEFADELVRRDPNAARELAEHAIAGEDRSFGAAGIAVLGKLGDVPRLLELFDDEELGTAARRVLVGNAPRAALSKADARTVEILAAAGPKAADVLPEIVQVFVQVAPKANLSRGWLPHSYVPNADEVLLRELYRLFEQMGDAAVPALARLLSHEDVDVRTEAAMVLKEIGALARPALPAVLAALRRVEKGSERETLAVLAVELGAGPEETLPVLAPVAEARYSRHGSDASPCLPHDLEVADALARLGPAAVPVLRRVKRGNPWAVVGSMHCLGEGGESLAIELLSDEREQVRRAAGEILEYFWTPYRASVYRHALKSKDKEIRLPAVRGLAKAAAKDALARDLLLGAAGDEDARVRLEVAFGLSESGDVPASLVETLTAEFATLPPDERYRSAKALARVRPLVAAEAGLRTAAAHGDYLVQTEVVPALAKLGIRPGDAAKRLGDALLDQWSTEPIVDALLVLGPRAIDALPALERTLKGDWGYREERWRDACRVLAAMGPAARELLPLVRRTLDRASTESLITAGMEAMASMRGE